MRVFLDSLGCRLNEAELAAWGRSLRGAGLAVVGDVRDAEVAVLNTCAVTAAAARSSRQRARALWRSNPAVRTVLTGCFATLEAGAAAGLPGVDLVVPNGDKDRLPELILEHVGVRAPAALAEPAAVPLVAEDRRTRAFLKIQDGCRNRCSFCVVTLARGEERSRPVAELVAEANALHAGGRDELVLTGVHIGGYGSDTGSSLGELLDALLADTDLPRIRLGSLEPWDVGPELFDRWARSRRLMPQLHLPAQSGSATVLRRMRRRCSPEAFRVLAAAARAAVPRLRLTTDLITGFPGETPAEHAETCAFVEQLDFAGAHVFVWSPRAGTRAAGLPGRVEGPVARARSRELHALTAAGEARHRAACVGQRTTVVVERREERGRLVEGTDPYGHRLRIRDAPELVRGVAVDLCVEGEEDGVLIGRMDRCTTSH